MEYSQLFSAFQGCFFILFLKSSFSSLRQIFLLGCPSDNHNTHHPLGYNGNVGSSQIKEKALMLILSNLSVMLMALKWIKADFSSQMFKHVPGFMEASSFLFLPPYNIFA